MSTAVRPWAIVSGAAVNGLGVTRSLGAMGVRVAVIDSSEGPAFSSRYARHKLRVPHDRGSMAYVDAIAALGRRLGDRPILILTQEATVLPVAQRRDELAAVLRQTMPDADLAAMLISKERTQERAEAIGFPVPRTVRLTGPHELGVASALTFPVVLKPAAKSEAWERTNKKAYRFESFDDLCKTYALIGADGTSVVVQEWIEGTDADIYFTLVHRDESGRTIAHFSGRKLRQWPPAVGGTASCAPVSPEIGTELAALTTRFFDAVGCIGLASIEYKRDRRDGRFVMVEPTVGRTDYQEEVATLNGVNIAYAAYATLVGLPVPVPVQTRPRIWRDAIADARSAEAQPGLALPPACARWPRVDTIARVSDPAPWAAAIAARIRARISGSSER